MRTLRDERGVVVGWLVKVLAGIAVAGVVLFDVGSVAVNYFGLDSAATDIANSLSTSVSAGRRFVAHQVEEEARELAALSNAELVAVEFDAREHRLTVILERHAQTLLAHRISALDDMTAPTVSAHARTQ